MAEKEQMEERDRRHIELACFLRAHGYAVKEQRSPSGRYVDGLEVGWREIRDQTTHLRPLMQEDQPPAFSLQPSGS
jgi:hypothetical protein